MKAKKVRKLVATTSLSYFPIEIYHNDDLIDGEGAGGTNYLDERGHGVVDLDSNLSAISKHEVLIHELIHLADTAFCLKLSERKVTALGHALAQALQGLTKVPRRRKR